MKPKYLWAVAAVVALAAAALGGRSAIAADRYTFRPPPGWQAVSVLTSRIIIGQWMEPHPTSFGQNINITSEKYSGSLGHFVQLGQAGLRKALPDIAIGDTTYGKTCGNHLAAHFASQSTVSGRVIVFEQVASVWFGWGYTVTYTRTSSEPMDDQARASLTSLCVFQSKRPPAVVPPALPGAGGSPAAAPSPTPQPTPAPASTPGGYYTAAPAATATIGVPAPTATP